MTETENRLKSLFLRQELHVGNLSNVDMGIIMIAASLAIPKGVSLAEKVVTEKLHGWLSTVGCNVQADAVELRRYLVDSRCLERDQAGSAYHRVVEWPGKWREIGQELERLDLESFANQVRTEEVEIRAARKKAALEAREHPRS